MKKTAANIDRKASQYKVGLRERATPAELKLCDLLDTNKISYMFQKSVYDRVSGRMFIVDFEIHRTPVAKPKGLPRKKWFPDRRKLFVEVDGSFHDDRAAYDAWRSEWIRDHRNGLILRFTNDDVFSRPQFVVDEICKHNPVRKTVYLPRTSPRFTKRNKIY